ncbi:hypothetical protein HAX54_001700, partial [Datura stramonium]|nr:hypothetical protein [Datura stramonium]
MVGLSVGEKNFIKGGIAQDLRNDGRKRLTYRPIYVETGVIPQANGSARVQVGVQSRQSHHLRAEEVRNCHRAIDSTWVWNQSGVSLDQRRKKICWDLVIALLVIDSDGNLLDALGAAIKRCCDTRRNTKALFPYSTNQKIFATEDGIISLSKQPLPNQGEGKAALSNTGIPRVQVREAASSDEQADVDISDEEFLQFDTSGVPVIVTLTKVGRGLHCRRNVERGGILMSSAKGVRLFDNRVTLFFGPNRESLRYDAKGMWFIHDQRFLYEKYESEPYWRTIRVELIGTPGAYCPPVKLPFRLSEVPGPEPESIVQEERCLLIW